MITKTLRLLSFVMLTAVASVTACSSTVRYALLGSRDHSTTEGEAQFEERDGGGYTMSIALDRLPTAERLGMPSVHFLVWTRSPGTGTFARATELSVNESNRTGRAHANVASRALEVAITAETSADVTTPSETVLVAAVLDHTD